VTFAFSHAVVSRVVLGLWGVLGLWAALGRAAVLLQGVVDEFGKVGGGEVFIVFERVERQLEQVGEGLVGISGGAEGEADEVDEVQRRAEDTQAAQGCGLKEEPGRENMSEQSLVVPPDFVVNT
jgi:hypothetical protein